MEGFDPIQWSPLIDTTTGSAFSAVNHANSSRPGCPRNSILTEVCGIVKQSRLAPGAAPSKSSSKVDGEFHCCLCGGTFSRKHSVKAHFVKCVDRNGNPDGKSWNDHPSIGSYKPRKVIPKQQKNRAADKWQSSWYPSSSGLLPPSGFQASPNGPTPGESPTIDPGLRGTMSIDITIGDTAQASPFLEETSPSATGSTGSHTVQPLVETEVVQATDTQPDNDIRIGPGFAITDNDGHAITFVGHGFWWDGEKMWRAVPQL